MATSRINKFIFPKANAFLRLKTMAKDLKVVKEGDNYVLNIPKGIDGKTDALVPVICVADFDLDSKTADKDTIKTKFPWGYLIEFLENEMVTYFVIPKDSTYAIEVGPMPSALEDKKLEIDWGNLQWVLQN